MIDIGIRKARKSDDPLIYATWLREYRRSVGRPPAAWYYAAQSALVASILARSDVHIAHYPGDPDQILAYAVTCGPVLHWAYTKGTFRRLGIMRKLLTHALPDTPRKLTHWTRDADATALALSLERDTGALKG